MPERQDPEGRLLARAAEIRRNFPFNGLLDRFRIDADGRCSDNATTAIRSVWETLK